VITVWFFTSPQIVHGEDSLSYIRFLEGERALIVSDPRLQELGVVAQIDSLLREAGFVTEVFANVEAEPTVETVQKGAALAARVEPDWFVGLGGGSVLDAAKAIRVLYERPDLEVADINPVEPLGLTRTRLLAIPTTSGTGSEATWAVVLSDSKEKRKLSTGSREIVPDVAIVDPAMTRELPPRITADTGMDTLTHAIEGYTCTWRNDFSDGLCLKAAELSFQYLERAVTHGSDDGEAREGMANAATLAGLGFGNANLGLAHAMGHSLGALLGLPHGRAVGLLLPYTMEFTLCGGSSRYADISRFIRLSDGASEDEAGAALIAHICDLAKRIGQPGRIRDTGVSERVFESNLGGLCDRAEMDTQFFTAPRIPDRDELNRLFRCAYHGRTVDF
jgi:alcohol dehydrogenase class IV